MKHSASLILLSFLIFLSGCQSPYYAVLEKAGIHKRDILVDRVKEGKKSQQEAKEQFQSALEKFTALTEFNGGDLEKIYNRLDRALKRSENRAEDVSARIKAIKSVSSDLFKEWESELKQYQNQQYRRISEQQLEQTRSRYEDLMIAMKKAEKSIQPVLMTFRDQVLFLKHNLNAQAIASLDTQADLLKTDIQRLVTEMEASIEEADDFIETMNQLS